MSSVPEEVVIEILSRLPVKSLFRFKCVCKAWLHLLTTTDSGFAQLQLTRSTKSDNTTLVFAAYDSHYDPTRFFSTECNIKAVKQGKQVNLSAPFVTPILAALGEGFNIIGSCNGLLCVRPLHNTDFYLWNPCTKEYLNIPSPPHERRLEHQHAAHRFGFHPLRNEYKLVIIFSSSFLEPVPAPAHVYVYTLGAAVSSWRRAIQDIPYHVADGFSYRSLVNGAFHWSAIPSGANHRMDLILSFDLGSEVLGEIPTPTGVYVNKRDALISELDGNLCLSCLFTPRQGSPPQVQIWVMKHYGVVTSWSKMYVFEQFSDWRYCHLLPVDVLEDGQILFVQEVHRKLLVYNPRSNSTELVHRKLLVYDPRSNSTELFPHLRFYQVYPLVRSLVSPRFINGSQ